MTQCHSLFWQSDINKFSKLCQLFPWLKVGSLSVISAITRIWGTKEYFFRLLEGRFSQEQFEWGQDLKSCFFEVRLPGTDGGFEKGIRRKVENGGKDRPKKFYLNTLFYLLKCICSRLTRYNIISHQMNQKTFLVN